MTTREFWRWVMYYISIMLVFIGVSEIVKAELPVTVIILAMILAVLAVNLEKSKSAT